jgi:hypothetical protein
MKNDEHFSISVLGVIELIETPNIVHYDEILDLN